MVKVWKHSCSLTVSKHLEFVDKFCCIVDDICGDKCLDFYYGHKYCECGDTRFNSMNNLYCCIPKNEECIIKGMYRIESNEVKK